MSLKYDQIDVALMFLGDGLGTSIMLQFEGREDINDARAYLTRELGYPMLNLHNGMLYPCGSIRFDVVGHKGSYGWTERELFFIEKDGRDYEEGTDIDMIPPVSSRVRIREMDVNDVDCDLKPIPFKFESTTVSTVKSWVGVTQFTQGKDKQTLVVQYNYPHDLGAIRSIVHRYRMKQATAHIDTWREVDVFVNMGGYTDLNGNRWARIVYECLKDNPNPSPNNTRYPDACVVKVDKTFTKPDMTFDKLIEGR